MRAHTKSIGLLVFLLFLGGNLHAQASEATGYIDGLKEVFETVQEAAGIVDGGAIYTKRHIDRTWYLPRNDALRDAGLELLQYLYENERIVSNLEVSDWISVTDQLLVVDKELAGHVAWGNLVIKAKICNDLLFQLLHFLDDPVIQLSGSERRGLLDLIRRLRLQLPTEAAMYSIAFRYYAIEPPLDIEVDRLDHISMNVDSAVAKVSSDELLSTLRRNLRKDEDKDNDQLLKEIELQEREAFAQIGNFIELYQTPIPLHTAGLTDFREYLWDIYFNLVLLERGRFDDVTDWEAVQEEVVFELLDEELASTGEYWMGTLFPLFIRKEVPRSAYLARIRSGGGIDTLRQMDQVRKHIAGWPDIKRSALRQRVFVLHSLK